MANPKPSACLVLLAVPLLCAPAVAQSLITFDMASNSFVESPAVSPAFPAGGPAGAPFPGAGVLMPSGPPLGGCALDNTTGILYATDGTTITATNHPAYGPLASPPAPFPKPAILGGPLTGLAIDPGGAPGGILYCTDGLSFVGISPTAAGHPTIIPLWGITTPAMTGIEWDPRTGFLMAVDASGNLYDIIIGMSGPPVFQAPPPFPLPGTATGVTFDRTSNAIPTPGTYVSVNGGMVVEYFGMPAGLTLPLPLPADGIAFHALPASLGGSSLCTPGGAPSLTANSPAHDQNAAFAVTFGNLTPGALLTLFFDFPSNALLAAPVPFGSGQLWLDPFFSPTIANIPFGPVPGPSLVLTVPLAGAPVGLSFIAQGVTQCPAGAFPGLALTNALQIIVARP